jgi:hypothetical protein
LMRRMPSTMSGPRPSNGPPFKAFRTVGNDIFGRRIEAVRHRTARCLWPEARPHIVGAAAEQQIEAPAMRGEEFIPASGGPIGHGPVSVGETVFAGGLDHSVQRDVLDDLELSYLSLRFLAAPCRLTGRRGARRLQNTIARTYSSSTVAKSAGRMISSSSQSSE